MNELEARKNLVKAIQDLIGSHMKWDDEKARTWMTTENPNLGMESPIYFIMARRSHKLLAFIESAIDENDS